MHLYTTFSINNVKQIGKTLTTSCNVLITVLEIFKMTEAPGVGRKLDNTIVEDHKGRRGGRNL